MAQLTLYLDEETARRVADAARKAGLSRSAWIRSIIMKQLEDRLPESFFEILGTWEDAQLEPEEILARIRENTDQPERKHVE
ncbi:MAG: ribbon-helix-helix protein, CopG family [Deltaproteobacteria bacterium]|nr:ribbon-helix-helix protein, CopG family [Deltaproteobacteria bacterium]